MKEVHQCARRRRGLNQHQQILVEPGSGGGPRRVECGKLANRAVYGFSHGVMLKLLALTPLLSPDQILDPLSWVNKSQLSCVWTQMRVAMSVGVGGFRIKIPESRP